MSARSNDMIKVYYNQDQTISAFPISNLKQIRYLSPQTKSDAS